MTRKTAISAHLAALPDHAKDILTVMKESGGTACIFGGAVRDTDCSTYYGRIIPVNDYDVRVWLPSSHYQKAIDASLAHLFDEGADIKRMPNADSEPDIFDNLKPRYEVKLFDCTLDISFRSKHDALFTNSDVTAAVAADRVMDSDIGLSGVAVALTSKNILQAFALTEYLTDRAHCRLSVFPTDHNERSLAYAERLKNGSATKPAKYPNHTIHLLK